MITQLKKHLTSGANSETRLKKKILVLDQHDEILSEFLRASRSVDVQMISHKTIGDASKDLSFSKKNNPFRAAFIDMDIGHFSGISIYKVLRLNNPELPIIMMSGGFHYKALIPIIAEDPCMAFLSKPFSAEDLEKVIRQPLTRAGDVRELLEQAILMRDTSYR